MELLPVVALQKEAYDNHLDLEADEAAPDNVRVPTRSGNREKVGSFVIGREVGDNVGKNKTP